MANGKYIRVNDSTGLLEELEALEVSTGVADASKPIKTDSTGKSIPNHPQPCKQKAKKREKKVKQNVNKI